MHVSLSLSRSHRAADRTDRGQVADHERITLHEAADRLGIHYMTAYRYVRTGRLAAELEGARWMVDAADLERLLAPDAPARAKRGQGRARARSRLLDRMLAADEAGAWAVLDEAIAGGANPADVHLDLVVPTLQAVGDGWEAGDLTVADEHTASAVASRLIGRLGPRFARRGPKRGTVVLGAPSGEQHALPSAILSDLLRGAGFHAIDLGAETPPASFAETAVSAPRLVAVLIGVTTPGNDRSVRATVAALKAVPVAVPVLVGGAAVADDAHAARLRADGWTGRDARQAVATVATISAAAG